MKPLLGHCISGKISMHPLVDAPMSQALQDGPELLALHIPANGIVHVQALLLLIQLPLYDASIEAFPNNEVLQLSYVADSQLLHQRWIWYGLPQRSQGMRAAWHNYLRSDLNTKSTRPLSRVPPWSHQPAQ